jgi:hypothetical protein
LCYTGLRFSDFTQIQPENINGDNTMLLSELKTSERVAIPLHKTVRTILKKNNKLPKAYTNQVTNVYLKRLQV